MVDATSPHSDFRPNYLRVWGLFFRNSLIREMTFRGHFLLTVVTRAFWFATQLVLFDIIYRNVPSIAGWTREEYYVFIATSMMINGLVEAFYMPNCAEFSEQIRTGSLDLVLLKPIDTQFMVSLSRVNLSMLSNVGLAVCLLAVSMVQLGRIPTAWMVLQYLLLVGVAVMFFYSLMIVIASTVVWMGRNQGLYEFWFYITVFARYPSDIYSGIPLAELIRFAFSYVIPILLVVTVPARTVLNKVVEPGWTLAIVPTLALLGLFVSRRVFLWSITHYRSSGS